MDVDGTEGVAGVSGVGTQLSLHARHTYLHAKARTQAFNLTVTSGAFVIQRAAILVFVVRHEMHLRKEGESLAL